MRRTRGKGRSYVLIEGTALNHSSEYTLEGGGREKEGKDEGRKGERETAAHSRGLTTDLRRLLFIGRKSPYRVSTIYSELSALRELRANDAQALDGDTQK